MNPEKMLTLLRRSKKYGSLCDEALFRISKWALESSSSDKQALKRAKRKLHQISGAYITPADQRRIGKRLGSFPPDASEAEVRALCRSILVFHSSTRERLPYIQETFEKVIDGATTILDLACGLNPFGLPWMNLPAEARYTPVDMDCALVGEINRFLRISGRPDTAQCIDLLSSPPAESYDLILLLKTLPCLERQETGASLRLLTRLRAQRIVISFPIRSLGGRRKNMEDGYARFMQDLLKGMNLAVETLSNPSEMFFILTYSSIRFERSKNPPNQ
jgi:16S rRNA (guanine(1405)-N(7))-methyltransferase